MRERESDNCEPRMIPSAERYDIIQQNQSFNPQLSQSIDTPSKDSPFAMQNSAHTNPAPSAPFWSTSLVGGPPVSVGGQAQPQGIVAEREPSNSILYNNTQESTQPQQHTPKLTVGGPTEAHAPWQKQTVGNNNSQPNQPRQPHILVGGTSHQPNQLQQMPQAPSPYQPGQGPFLPMQFHPQQNHAPQLPMGSMGSYGQQPWAGVPPGTIILLQPPAPTSTPGGPQMPQVYSIPQNQQLPTPTGLQFMAPMDGSQTHFSSFPTAMYGTGQPQPQLHHQPQPLTQGQFIVSAPPTPRTANGTSARTSFSESGSATPLHVGEATVLQHTAFGAAPSATSREVELSLRPVHLRSTDPAALSRPPWDSPNARLLSSQDVCKEHLSRGCRHGSRCQYLHLPDTWRPFPDQICRDFLRGGGGACGRSKCRFFHGFTSELAEATAYLQGSGILSQRVFVFHADGGPEPSHPLQDQLFLLYKK